MDATGRVTGRREVDPEGGDHTYAYTHNAMGELTEVRRDGALVESYAYDLDGDRTSQGATYDAAGRLTSRNGIELHVRQRRLPRRARRRLVHLRPQRRAALGHGRRHHGLLRLRRHGAHGRPGRRAADTTRYVYGDPDSPYRVSAARAPDGTLDRYLYGPRGNLYAILRGAARFHVGTDQVGSPRIVAAADGTVVKRLEYDAYGVTTDHDPGFFLPFGYAGRPARPGHRARALRAARLRAPVRPLHRARPRDVRRLPAVALRLREQLARLLPRPGRHGVPQLRRLRRRRRRRDLLLRPGRVLRPRQAAHHRPLRRGAASAWAAASRSTSSRRRPRRRASPRSRSSAGVVPGASRQVRRGVRPDLRDRQAQVGRQHPRRCRAATTTPARRAPGSASIPAGFKVEGKAGLKACLPPPPR